MNGPVPDQSWRDLLGEGRAPRFALICLGVWLNAADALVVATIMPSVGGELGGYAYFGWAMAGYFTGAILAGATAGRLSEIFGLRPAMAAAGLIYAAGCVLDAVAGDIGAFLAGRLVQGLGAGWISGFVYVAIGRLFPERHLARAFAAGAAVWGAAIFLGPLAGGLFAEAGAWRGVFWMFAAQAAAFSLATFRLLPRDAAAAATSGVPARQVGLIAAGVAAISVSGLSGRAWAAAALGAAGIALLWRAVRVDARAATNLFPRQAGALSTPVGAGYAAMFAMCVGGMGLTVYGPAVLQTLRGHSPLTAGLIVAGETLGWTLAALAVTGAGARWQARWIRTGPALLAGALVGLAFCFRDGPFASVILLSVLQGAGFGVAWAFMSQAVLTQAPRPERAVASSALACVQQTGTAIGAALAGAVANLAGATGETLTREAARSTGLWIFVAALPLAGLGIAFAWRLAAHSGSVACSSHAR